MTTILTPEEEVVQAARAWHSARYPDLDFDRALYTSDRLHEAVERLLASVSRHWYRCSVCKWTDDVHPFAVCKGGEWVRETTPT